jgi:two-component system, chemotaxis family, CheB/CheR fusion protein
MAGRKIPKKAKAERPTTPAAAEEQKTGAASFPIIGLGASAGGLEAFEHFFRKVPRDSGMAFVLVTHLDPGRASTLTEILQRSTAMPVQEAQDQVAVMPNSVYIIPPNRDMAIFHGTLQLSLPEQPRGHRMPIDAFLRSLADDQGEQAIGVILSGTGTDGTLGLRAVLGAGGVSFVQEPATAKYDGMPASAIQAGYATYVLPVEKMPEALLVPRRTVAVRQDAPPAATGGLNRILMLLRSGTGHDFSQYKKTTIGRRIDRRMSQHEIEDMEVYARYLKEHPAEVHLLVKELLINVTSFFRNPEAFETLKKDVLPQLFAGKPEGSVFRVWVAGCATGEEAYSIAMLLREFMDETRQEFKVQLYSTDLDDDAIAVARAGTYSPNIVQDVSPERLLRFFVKDEAGYRVKKEIRGMVVFAIQNVIKDPPFTRLDLISCRNLMIYLEPELQDRLITAFQFALKPGGVLFLSPSESTGAHSDLFAPLSREWRIYRATHSVASTRALMAGVLPRVEDASDTRPDETGKIAKEIHFAELTKRALLQRYAPASVVTDLNGTILYVHGETGKYLRPAPGKATLNVAEMARDDLQLELRAALHSAARQGASTISRELSVNSDGDIQPVNFSVRPLLDLDAGEGLLLISFQDGARSAPGKPARGKRATGSADLRHIEELERDLAYTKENLQATIEEQQASNEELESTNEELQSTNEELQSTNEELETSKEELQSLNEELVTVNAELQSKIQQMASMQDDLKNLFDSNSIGTIFLDERLIIRSFTRDAVYVYHLAASDVGRPLRDIKSDLESEDLLVEAQRVLESLVPCEHEVRTTDGSWYLARIQPYRTLDNVIRGVVLTFVPLTELKRAEEALGDARKLAEDIIDTVREPLIVLDGAFQVISASRSFYQRFRVTPDETVGRPLYELGDHQWDIPALRELLETVLPRHRSFDDYVVEQDFPAIGRCKMLLSARRIVRKTENTELILLAIEMRAPGEKESA